VLKLDGTPQLEARLDDRRRLLLYSLRIAGTFCLVPQLTGGPAQVLAQSKTDGWDGLIAERADSRYLPGGPHPRRDQTEQRTQHRRRDHRLANGPGPPRRHHRLPAPRQT